MPLSDYPIRFAPTVNCEQDQGGTDQGRAESGRLRRSDERRTEKAGRVRDARKRDVSSAQRCVCRIDIELRAADFEAVKRAVLAVISNAEYVCERQGTRVVEYGAGDRIHLVQRIRSGRRARQPQVAAAIEIEVAGGLVGISQCTWRQRCRPCVNREDITVASCNQKPGSTV